MRLFCYQNRCEDDVVVYACVRTCALSACVHMRTVLLSLSIHKKQQNTTQRSSMRDAPCVLHGNSTHN